DLAAGWLVDPGEQPGDGALAAAALAGQRDDLPLADAQRDVVDGVQGAPRQRVADLEVLGQPVCAQQQLRLRGARGGALAGGLLGHCSLLASWPASSASWFAVAALLRSRPRSYSRQRTCVPST